MTLKGRYKVKRGPCPRCRDEDNDTQPKWLVLGPYGNLLNCCYSWTFAISMAEWHATGRPRLRK